MTAIVIPNTFIPSTTISSTEMNANFTAVAAAISASLPKDGSEAMTGQLLMPAGSVGTPALSFNTDQNTGIYSLGADQIGFTAGGVRVASMSLTGSNITQSDDGAAAGPTLTVDRISASPAVNDAIGQINFQGRDSGGNGVVYAAISARILDATDTSEDGQLELRARINDVNTVLLSLSGNGIRTSAAGVGIGYSTGAGGAVTQITSRTTGVTLNTTCGAITLVSAAGLASYQSFTVTNSVVEINDSVRVTQRTGTDLYEIHVTATSAGSFRITYRTTGGTTVEQPVFNFAVIKASNS